MNLEHIIWWFSEQTFDLTKEIYWAKIVHRRFYETK